MLQALTLVKPSGENQELSEYADEVKLEEKYQLECQEPSELKEI
jgi:hypothetical protein